MRDDIKKFLALLMGAGLIGLLYGYPLHALLLAALGLLGWQIYRLHKLHKWVTNPNKHPINETSGQFYLIHRELSRRTRTNRARKRRLTSYLAQFQRAVAVLPDAIVMIDERGKIQWANRNADKLLGIKWPNDNGVRFTDLIRDPAVAKLLDNPLSHDIAEGPDEGIEITSLQNYQQTINLKLIPYTDELSMVLARDVSRLIKINRLHADFVANVSHELKTPLTVLKGYVEIMQNTPELPAKLSKPLQQMGAQGERMELIVQDLLFLSKLEAEDNRDEHELVDVTLLINTIVETVQPALTEKSQKLELNIDYQMQVRGNQHELHSAFANLIINAVNYTQPAGIIKVHWREGDDGAVFSVSDTGPGIPRHHIPRLTERFYRIDDDRSREGGGTGLGLAIVKHVLQRHDAELEIDSREGRGSVFRCLFPQHRIHVEQVANQN